MEQNCIGQICFWSHRKLFYVSYGEFFIYTFVILKISLSYITHNSFSSLLILYIQITMTEDQTSGRIEASTWYWILFRCQSLCDDVYTHLRPGYLLCSLNTLSKQSLFLSSGSWNVMSVFSCVPHQMKCNAIWCYQRGSLDSESLCFKPCSPVLFSSYYFSWFDQLITKSSVYRL